MVYCSGMTKLLEEAISRLRDLPEEIQDLAARHLIHQLEEEPEPGDIQAIEQGRSDIRNGDFVSHEQLRHELGLDRR